MTLEEYLNLIPAQHRQKPRYMAAVEAVLKPVCGVEDVLRELRTAFDLDTAIGAQLDAVGVRVGRSRWLYTPLEGVYFSLNIEGVGLEEGAWLGRFDPIAGLTRLPDDIYRLLLKSKVVANQWNGTTPQAYEAWKITFEDTDCLIVVQDNQDMSMVVGIAGTILSTVFEQLLVQNYIPLKPEGVRINYYAISTEAGPIFALDCDNEALAGFERGSWAKELYPIV